MANRKRQLALLTAIAVAIVILFSITFIALELDHDCVGDNCPICQQLSICNNTLHLLSAAIILAALVLAILAASYFYFAPITACILRRETLVSRKVKLSD